MGLVVYGVLKCTRAVPARACVNHIDHSEGAAWLLRYGRWYSCPSASVRLVPQTASHLHPAAGKTTRRTARMSDSGLRGTSVARSVRMTGQVGCQIRLKVFRPGEWKGCWH